MTIENPSDPKHQERFTQACRELKQQPGEDFKEFLARLVKAAEEKKQ